MLKFLTPIPPRRSSDPDVADFTARRIPKKWRNIVIAVGSIGAFVGSFYVTISKMQEPKHDESPSFSSEKLTTIELKLEDLAGEVQSIAVVEESMRTQIREIRKEILNRKQADLPCSEERAVDRQEEIMSLLNEFKEFGICQRKKVEKSGAR